MQLFTLNNFLIFQYSNKDVFKDLQKFFIVESTVQVNTSAQNVAYFSGEFIYIMLPQTVYSYEDFKLIATSVKIHIRNIIIISYIFFQVYSKL